jgi:hypothetical protein
MARKSVSAGLIYLLTLLALTALAVGAFAWLTCPDPEAGNPELNITHTQKK